RKNALEITDRRFDDDVERLMRRIDKVLTGAEARAHLPEPYQHLNVRPEPLPLADVVTSTPIPPQTLETKPPAETLSRPEPGERVSKRDGLYFSKDHEWIKVEGTIGTIGISNYAQNALGDIVYIELPRKGDSYSPNDSFGAIESVKAVSELFCPVSGEIVSINEALTDEPERV